MKVLLVTGSFPPMRCGVGDYTRKLADALAQTGLAVGVLTGVDAATNPASGGITIFPVMQDWRLSSIGKFLKILRGWKPDVVHVQYPTQGYGAAAVLPSLIPWLAWVNGIRAVRTWHEIPTGTEKSFLLQASAPGSVVVTRREFGSAMPSLARRLLSHRHRHHIPIGSNIPAVELSDEERTKLRARYLGNDAQNRRIVVYFGFFYRFKGLDQLFDICDPLMDHVIFIGDATVDEEYTAEITRRADGEPWRGHTTLLGYLSQEDIARHLALADAVVLPFRRGGGIGNGTIHAAVLQGTPVITTSLEASGYNERENSFYAAPDDVDAMRNALVRMAGRRRPAHMDADDRQWQNIAAEHQKVYDRVLSGL